MKCLRSLVVTALLLPGGLVLAPPPAQAQLPVTDIAHIAVTTWAEILRYSQMAYSIINELESLYNQYQQIKNQIQALEKLSVHNWRDIGPLYHQLDGILNEAESLTYVVDDLEAKFEAAFPGTQAFLNFPEEHRANVTQTLQTLRLNMMSLKQISDDSRGSLQTLGSLQLDVERSQGHEQTLEAMAGLSSWQAQQLATMGATLQSLANVSTVAASYQIDQAARSSQTTTDIYLATHDRATAEASQSKPSYTLVPSWMPPL
jgi:P-type conjugative transfer protein TrbJ